VIAVLGRKAYHVAAVEAYLVVAHQIGVFILVHPRCREIDHATLLVHVFHPSDKPFAFGNLSGLRRDDASLLVGGAQVVEVDVVPVVALRGPKQLLAVIDGLSPQSRIVDKCLRPLLDDGSQVAGLGTHRQQLVQPVPALVILHRDLPGVGCPLKPLEGILVLYGPGVGLHPMAGGNVDDGGPVLGQLVARLGILLLVKDGLQPVGGRRLHIVGIPFGHLIALAYHDLAGVGAPRNIAAVIAPDGTVLREHTLLGIGAAHFVHHNVVSLDPRLALAVGRLHHLLGLLVVGLHPVPPRTAERTIMAVAAVGADAQGLLERVFRLKEPCRPVGNAVNCVSAARILIGVIDHGDRILPPHVVCPMAHVLLLKLVVKAVGSLIVGHRSLCGSGGRYQQGAKQGLYFAFFHKVVA